LPRSSSTEPADAAEINRCKLLLAEMSVGVWGSLLEGVGRTPLLRLRGLSEELGVNVYVKLEFLNPTGSHKDRIAYYMIRDAIERYGLEEGRCVVECSSGNTAISVAFVAAQLGLRAVIVAPEETSPAKLSLIKLLGAEVVLGSSDPSSDRFYCRIAERISRERGCVFLNQYANEANARAHYETTAPEIWEALGGRVDAFVMGVGTGGTVTGVGRFLKERGRALVVAVTPRGSLLSGGEGGDRIEGLITEFVPPLLDLSVVDRIIAVSAGEALEEVRRLAVEEGLLVGHSTGANIAAIRRIAHELAPGANVVTLACDSALRYLHLLT